MLSISQTYFPRASSFHWVSPGSWSLVWRKCISKASLCFFRGERCTEFPSELCSLAQGKVHGAGSLLSLCWWLIKKTHAKPLKWQACSVKKTHLPWGPLQIHLIGHHPVYKKIKILDDKTSRHCVKLLLLILLCCVLNFSPTLTYLTFQTTLGGRPIMTYLLQMKKLRVWEVNLLDRRGANPDLLRVYAFFLTCSISCFIFLVHNLFVVRKADFKRAKPGETGFGLLICFGLSPLFSSQARAVRRANAPCIQLYFPTQMRRQEAALQGWIMVLFIERMLGGMCFPLGSEL